MSVLYIVRNRVMTLSLVFMLLLAACGPQAALAAGVEDVMKEVAGRNARVEEGISMSFGVNEPIPGGSQRWSEVGGDLNTGEQWAGAWFTIAEPVGGTSMQAVIDAWELLLEEDTRVNVVPMDGYELREITYADYSWGLAHDDIEVWIVLPKYLIMVDIYETGYDKAANLQMGKNFALQMKDGLEKAGLLSPSAPATAPAEDMEQPAAPVPATAGKPLDEPVKVSDTMNIAGVYNGPTVPTTFTVNSPHLVTFITTYHWNNARGAPGGTIALQGSDGKMYGPWKVSTRPGQGGVPNAYWEVSPNVVVPAGTYTVIDSDPATWSQNQQSGGRGMGEVKATPHFEAAAGSSGASGKRISDPWAAADGWTESPAGVGSVGNIPGPSNAAEAVVGVAVPGLIATVLGALAGIGGGGGGFAPPAGTPLTPAGGGPLSGAGGRPTSPAAGGGPSPGAGGGAAGAGAQSSAAVQEAGQLGRKRRKPGSAPVPGAGADAAVTGRETAGVSPGEGPTTAGVGDTAIPTRPEPTVAIETAAEKAGAAGTGSDGADVGISIDTSALEDEILTGKETGAEESGAAEKTVEVFEENAYDREGYDREGFNKEGFDRDGFNKEGFNKAGFDREGFDKAGFNAKGLDREGYNKAGFNADGYNREGFNKAGFDRDGFNKEGFDKAGFDREGFDKAGFNAKGLDREGYNKAGFNADGYNREGFNKAGFDKEGFNEEGFNKAGFDREGFDKSGFNAKGLDREGYNKAGFNADGYNREGFNKAGFDRDGFNKEGFDKAGFDREGFNKAGFNAKGLDREGFNKDGFNAEGYNREGFNKAGFDRDGFNKEGFDKAGFDREGYGRSGFDKNGYDREGYDVNGYNQKGYNRSGYNAKGFDAQGYDKDGFNKDGWDREGYGRDGLDQNGFDREGYDKAGYDQDGYNREGFDKDGRQKDGSDEYGYGKDGFNENGFDKDGFDREGFNYEGYNRSGYDPWGYNKQGYDKDGYHWSGYNADGYNRSGRHWSEKPSEADGSSPFGVDTSGNGVYTVGGKARSPFEEDAIIILDGVEWKPEKPPLGEPYPKTVEKYGTKPWTDEIPQPEPEKPAVPKPEEPGVIGPEDPMNTLEQYGLDKGAPAAGKEDVPLPAAEAERPDSPEVPAEDLPVPEGTQSAEPGIPGVPRDGEKRILVGKTDGRSMEIEYNSKTGEWTNTESGGIVDPDKFEQWQNDLAEDRSRSAADLEKMGERQDAHSQAVDQNLADWKKLEQMQKAADKYNVGEPGGPGDVDKAVQKLKDDMLTGKEVDRGRMEQINKIIDDRIKGVTSADTGDRWEEVPWYKDLESALKANMETAKEVVTGEKEDGSISWLGMGARAAIGAATGGTSEYIMTVTEAMGRVKESIDKGETGFRAAARAIGQLVLEEMGGELVGAAGGKAMQSFAEKFPNFTNKAADLTEKIGLAVAAGDLIASSKLGLIGKQSAEEALANLAKQMDDIGAGGLRKIFDDKVAGAGLKVASADDLAKAFGRGTAKSSDDLGKAIGKAAAGGSDDMAKKAGKAAAGSSDDMAKGAGKATAGSSDDLAKGAGKAADGPDLPAKKGAGKADEAAGKAASAKTVQTETPGLQIDNSSFKNAGQPADLRGMPARDQKAIQMVSDRHGVKAQMRPTNPESKKWLETGKAHPKPEMLKTKTVNDFDVELGFPKDYTGTVACKKPNPLPPAKPDAMSAEHWDGLQKRYKQRMTEYTDQVEKLHHLEQEGKILWDKNTGVIYNGKTMKPYAGDHDAFAFVDAVSGKPVSPQVNQQLNRELQSLGATQHPEHVGWDYSGLSDKVPAGSPPGAQSPREIAEGIDRKILSGHDEGGQPLNTYNPLEGEKGGWTTSWWKGGVRQ